MELLKEVKTCKRCNEQKAVSEFYAYKNSNGDTRLRPRCKRCQYETWRDPNKPRRIWAKDKKSKYCARCGTTKPKSEFHISETGRFKTKYCKQCHSDEVQEKRLERDWGLTQDQYNDLLAKQGGVCAICGSSKSGTKKDGRLCIDHNHETGEIRGLLCASCNRGIGLLGDSSEMLLAACAYLKNHSC